MEVFTKDKTSTVGEIQIFIDQLNRLTNQKVYLISKHQKELLAKNILLKQAEQKKRNLEMKLNSAINKIETYEQQVLPNICSRTQELQLNINAFKSRILNLITDSDVQQSIDEKQLLQSLKRLDTLRKSISFASNSSENIIDSFISVSFSPLDTNEINIVMNSLERMVKLKTQENKYLQSQMYRHQLQINLWQQKWKSQFQTLQDQLKFSKQLIASNQRDFNNLRHQYIVLQKIVKDTQKSKSRLIQEITSNSEKVLKKSGVYLESISSSQLVNFIGSLYTRIDSLKQLNNRLQQQLYKCKFSHMQQVQQMCKNISKFKDQKQSELKRKQTQISNLKTQLSLK